MSLLKQLLLSVTLAIGCILAGTLLISFNTARDYLDAQLRAQADNAATSLALVLSQSGNQDPILRELLMSAQFDTGQFQAISLRSPTGEELFARVRPAEDTTAPGWFRDLAALDRPEATEARRDVSDGWRQVGELQLVVASNYASQALWQNSLRMLVMVLLAGGLWALSAMALVRWLTRALEHEVAAQVRAIGEGRVPDLPSRSALPELAGVARAIETAGERLRASSQEQTARIESLNVELNSDTVTGLANRRFMLNEIRRAVRTAAEGGEAAWVLVFRQRDLAQINRERSRDEVDQWLQEVGARVRALLPADGLAGRLNGSDFMVLLRGGSGATMADWGQRLREVLQAARLPLADGGYCRWALALTQATPALGVAGVLGGLDHALMRAESAGQDDVVHVEAEQLDANHALGESAWRERISSALTSDGLQLSYSAFPWGVPQGLTREASLELHDPAGYVVPAPQFMPAAVRLGLSDACDLEAIRVALAELATRPADTDQLMVRLSLPSLAQPGFVAGVAERLAAQPEAARRLILELDAHGLVAYRDHVQALAQQGASHGTRLGLRRLAQQVAALAWLHEVPWAYIKLGGGLLDDLQSSPGNQQLLVAIGTVARELGVPLLAEGKPDAASAPWLAAQGVYQRKAG